MFRPEPKPSSPTVKLWENRSGSPQPVRNTARVSARPSTLEK